jgi:hypothetical protein
MLNLNGVKMLSSTKNLKSFLALTLAVLFISLSGSFNSSLAQQPVLNPNVISIDPDAFMVSSGKSVTGQNSSPGLSAPLFVLNPAAQFILSDTFTLAANPGPPNNGGSPNWAIFLDFIAGPKNIIVKQLSTGNNGTANESFSVEVLTYNGTALGGPVGSGHGSSMAGWTSLGTVPAVQGSTSNGISSIFNIPSITVPAGDTVGVALRFNSVGPRYYGTGSPPYSIYSDSSLTLVTGDSRSVPFTPTGSWFSSRALTGVVRYVIDGI